MKKFEAPVLEVIEDFTMEPVYALSGTPDTPPEEEAKGCWKITAEWRNHNSGSHSELAIIGVHNGDHSGEGITMTFVVHGFKLECIKDSGGYVFSNVSETGFTVFRNGHFNPTERFEFNIQIQAKDTPYKGAVAHTGDVCPHKVICIAYTEC